MNSGVTLWNKAKKIIPGGNQLFSKRSEKFLPDYWPSYYKKAEGCEIWDLDNNHYYDFAGMGVGSCVLGYANEYVKQQVKNAIDEGSMSSLNSYEEVALAEKLLELHSWAEMARFARTGGEACAIAIRIARAATGKDFVAFCGYHGWHDWYLSANLGDSRNLDNQLLPGLNARGVPRQLQNTTLPFTYNKIDELITITEKHKDNLAAIVMEPLRGHKPDPGFLQSVRNYADKVGAVLIFDEVTSGFRINIGGIHLTQDVKPDIAVLGKAMGNGYPISAIIGRRAIMDAAQTSFISSTFWTERIGFVAALASIEFMQQENVPSKLIAYGNLVFDGWRTLAQKNDLKITVSGIPPLPHIHFDYPNALAIQTLYSQEMLDEGFLASASVATAYSHSEKIIGKFMQATDKVFNKIALAIHNNNVESLLKGPIAHSDFKRLT